MGDRMDEVSLRFNFNYGLINYKEMVKEGFSSLHSNSVPHSPNLLLQILHSLKMLGDHSTGVRI